MLNNKELTLQQIEEIECKYLNKYYHFLKFTEDEMFYGFKTKEDIKDDCIGLYGNEDGGISDFAVGAERIVYALLNGKGIGQPNSSPVGSDLFFEVEDAYIHIDMKTVNMENIGDFTTSIFVGKNQNSYRGIIKTKAGKEREYIPALPTYYNKGKKNLKICLSYFITMLYDRASLEIEVITLDCMPNAELKKYYGSRVLKAGKTPPEARFNIEKVNKFELLDNSPSRIKVIYFNDNMEENTKKKLKLFEDIWKKES